MEQLLSFFNNLNKQQKMTVIGGVGALFAFLVFIIVYTKINNSTKRYSEIIATSLSQTEVANVSAELESLKIPFSVDGRDNNLTLRTSSEFINIAKIKLITSEALSNKHNGWEIFDKSNIGTTKFENKIKYLQALEGELSRSVESLSTVLSASIKIAFPKETLFVSKKKPVTASAVLRIRDGMRLTGKQATGIKNFIASAIPELDTENIKLINQEGELLEESPFDTENSKYDYQVKYKKKLEKRLEGNIIELVEPIVGAGKIVAKVTVDLSFIKKNIQQEIYDPEGTIRSQQTNESSSLESNKKEKKNSEPGAANNINGNNNKNDSILSSGKKDTESITTNFEISKKIISQTDGAYATLNRVAVAVTFDATILDGVTNRGEYILNIEEIVKNAVAFKSERGDSVTVKSFKFLAPKNMANNIDNPLPWQYYLKEYSEFIKYLIVSLLIFLFYRKFIAATKNQNENELNSIKTSSDNLDEESNNDTTDSNNRNIDKFSIESQNQDREKELKDKVYTQLKTISNLDVESKVKYETLIDEINGTIDQAPEDTANMITLLLDEK